MSETAVETKWVPGNVEIEVWWQQCSQCLERIYANLPKGATKHEFIAHMEREGWSTRPTLCPTCQTKK